MKQPNTEAIPFFAYIFYMGILPFSWYLSSAALQKLPSAHVVQKLQYDPGGNQPRG